MTLIKTSILTSISTAFRIVCGFIVNKVMAVYVGPAGIALVGQFTNFVSIATLITSGGIKSGIVKYVAEYRDNPVKKRHILSTGIVVIVLASLVASIPIIVFSQEISSFLFKSEDYSSLIVTLGGSLILVSMSNFLLSVLNGQKEIGKYICVNISASIVGLALSVPLTIHFGIFGALLSIIFSQLVVFFVTVTVLLRTKWFNINDFIQGHDRDSFLKLGKFFLMVALSATLLPLSLITVRNYITEHISVVAAGYWEGLWRISDGYLMLITTSLSVYYLPRLSEIRDRGELRKEILYGYKVIMPITILLALAIFLSKKPIIKLLFTESFMPMIELFAFQLLGDIFKVASWLLSLLLHAKAMARVYVVSDVIFTLTFITFSMTFINKFGLIGVTYAYALNYFLYLLAMVYLFRDILFLKTAGEKDAVG